MASFIYIVVGSCTSITIGPTAIMATMVQSMVAKYGADIAVLMTFLKGCIITVLGLLHLGLFALFVSTRNKCSNGSAAFLEDTTVIENLN